MPGPQLNADQVVSREEALRAGLLEAASRSSGLLLMSAGLGIWRTAYPPATLTLDGAAEWARRNHFFVVDGDRYYSADEIANSLKGFAGSS